MNRLVGSLAKTPTSPGKLTKFLQLFRLVSSTSIQHPYAIRHLLQTMKNIHQLTGILLKSQATRGEQDCWAAFHTTFSLQYRTASDREVKKRYLKVRHLLTFSFWNTFAKGPSFCAMADQPGLDPSISIPKGSPLRRMVTLQHLSSLISQTTAMSEVSSTGLKLPWCFAYSAELAKGMFSVRPHSAVTGTVYLSQRLAPSCFGAGPGFFGMRARPRRRSRRLRKLGAPSGRPVRAWWRRTSSWVSSSPSAR